MQCCLFICLFVCLFVSNVTAAFRILYSAWSQLFAFFITMQFSFYFQALLHHKTTNVNVEGRNKYTPLHNAAHLEHRNALEICQKLVRTSVMNDEITPPRKLYAVNQHNLVHAITHSGNLFIIRFRVELGGA